MSSYPPPGPGMGGVGRRIEEAIELIEMELRHAAAYVNDAVIPQVRAESISALRNVRQMLCANSLTSSTIRTRHRPRLPRRRVLDGPISRIPPDSERLHSRRIRAGAGLCRGLRTSQQCKPVARISNRSVRAQSTNPGRIAPTPVPPGGVNAADLDLSEPTGPSSVKRALPPGTPRPIKAAKPPTAKSSATALSPPRTAPCLWVR
jgi:hypothetical protein